MSTLRTSRSARLIGMRAISSATRPCLLPTSAAAQRFSVMQFSRQDGRIRATPLAHGGVGIAGDVFDYRLIDRLVAPRLGKGTHYRSLGKVLPLPAYFHAAFAQWHQLSWLNTPQTLNELRRLAASSEAPQMLEDLATFIEMDLGFDLYQA